MKFARLQRSSLRAGSVGAAGGSASELAQLRARLDEAEETLQAIGSGRVDAVVVAGKQGDRVFTLQGADHAYRVLIESMNEGALTLSPDKMIIYANKSFARMVKCPLEQLPGSSFRRFLSIEDRSTLRTLLAKGCKAGAQLQVFLNAGDGSQTPVQISIRLLAENDFSSAVIGMVVTDMTVSRQNEDLLRALTHRVVKAQEAERGSVALELHNQITQLLCATLYRCQALAEKLSAREGPARQEAMKVRSMLGETANAVERISEFLRPSVLDELGLVDALHVASTEFTRRTNVPVDLTGVEPVARLPVDTELAFYRILQEALKNVERHARACHVVVGLTQLGAHVQLTIKDDGKGFYPDHHSARRKKGFGLGLLGMRERAASVGGTFQVNSVLRAGTAIEVRLPVPTT